MKHSAKTQIPVEFGFTSETFNLAIETTSDGERIAREEERKAVERAQSAAGQYCLLFIPKQPEGKATL